MRSRGRAGTRCRRGHLPVVLMLYAALGGCASLSLPPAPARERPAVELVATPFFAQREHQCGPAALAMVAGAQGVTTSADELTPALLVPAREGSLQVELQARARVLGLLAHPLRGGFQALLAELDAGHPVIVLQNNGLRWWPVWHYAVVIGYLPDSDTVVLRSGVTERHLLGRRVFERTWQRAGRWGLVVLAPGRVPASASAESYAASLSALEARGAPSGTARAWQAGAARWPEAWQFPFALGNQAASSGDLPAAVAALRRASALAPERGEVWNNLAVMLQASGDLDGAEAAIRMALGLGGPHAEEFARTAAEIAAARAGSRDPQTLR